MRSARPRAAAVLLLCVGLGLTSVGHPLFAEAATEGQLPAFPNFKLQPVDGGAVVSIESLRGRPVLLTFWASWCGPCRMELPELQKLNAELKDTGFVLLAVNVDSSPNVARRFLQTTGLEIPVYRMEQRDLVRVGVRSIPTNILLGLDGRPATVYEGYTPEVPQVIRTMVKDMVAARVATATPGP